MGAMALPLATAPWHLTTAQIGLFGIVGAAGALGASGAGRWADRGRAEMATGAMLIAFLGSWLAIARTPSSLLLLAIGLVILDFAGEAIHVINQHLIVESDPTATTRLIGGYMVYYSIGRVPWASTTNIPPSRLQPWPPPAARPSPAGPTAPSRPP
jgi:predicted MFS family arabinose efflux permease